MPFTELYFLRLLLFLFYEQAVAAGAEPDNGTATKLLELTIGIGADSVLDTTFGD
jgi:hypothetical protein